MTERQAKTSSLTWLKRNKASALYCIGFHIIDQRRRGVPYFQDDAPETPENYVNMIWDLEHALAFYGFDPEPMKIVTDADNSLIDVMYGDESMADFFKTQEGVSLYLSGLSS